MINDTQFDFYGTRMVTCDSSGMVKVCKMVNDDQIDPQSVAYLVDNEVS